MRLRETGWGRERSWEILFYFWKSSWTIIKCLYKNKTTAILVFHIHLVAAVKIQHHASCMLCLTLHCFAWSFIFSSLIMAGLVGISLGLSQDDVLELSQLLESDGFLLWWLLFIRLLCLSTNRGRGWVQTLFFQIFLQPCPFFSPVALQGYEC